MEVGSGGTKPLHRYWVVILLFILSMITYIDRAAISSAKEAVAADLSLNDQAMGVVFSVFALGYALGQVPLGWFADRWGPRLLLFLVVIAWSGFTALTGLAATFGALAIIRFLFGFFEAGAYPGSARAFYNWLPVGERGRANGIIFSGARIGAAVSFPLLTATLAVWGWRTSFIVLGFVGIVWALVWTLVFRDHPPERQVLHPGERSKQSLESGEQRFGEVFRSKAMLLAMGQYFAGNFTFFICLTWMYPYLREHYRLTAAEAGSYTMVPLLFGATAQWAAGFLVDWIYRSGLRPWSRRLPAMIGFVLAAGALVFVTEARTPTTAVVAFAIATFGVEMTISPSWAYCVDIGGKNSGAVSASMNMVGNIGSFVSANAFPLLYAATGAASTYFILGATLNLLAALLWFFMHSPMHGKFSPTNRA